MITFNKKVARVLEDAGVVDAEAIAGAMEKAEAAERPLSSILVEEDLIDERELLGGCGHCDVCERVDAEGGGAREVSGDDAVVVLKALSGVARVHGRAGLKAIAEMLHGKETQKLQNLGLNRLSTHGLLSDRPVEWNLALLRRLVTAGLVEVTPDVYPVPYLTHAGAAVMKRERPVRVLLPPAGAGKRAKRGATRSPKRNGRVELDREAEALFEALRGARAELAKTQGVPAYVVCHDRTLVGIAERKPASPEDLAEVHGMGPARIDAYGERFLDVVRSFAQ